MILPALKEPILSSMEELDAALQTAMDVRVKLWTLVSDIPPGSNHCSATEISLNFYDNGRIISWGNDSEYFTPSTFRILQKLWYASDHFLSKEDVRQDVQGDEYSTAETIRTLVKTARKEMNRVRFPYEIETLWGKGYRMRAVHKRG